MLWPCGEHRSAHPKQVNGPPDTLYQHRASIAICYDACGTDCLNVKEATCVRTLNEYMHVKAACQVIWLMCMHRCTNAMLLAADGCASSLA
jgi:hypothetical protein